MLQKKRKKSRPQISKMSLPQTIKSLFDRTVSINYDGHSNEHPIIVLNALKNIIGDNQKSPSQSLLDAMSEVSEQNVQRNDDQYVLDCAAKDGLGLTVFISDLEDACQSGNPLDMETEAARLQWVSENGLGGLEVLIEVALQDFDRLGLFAYHLQRANAFNQDVKNTWFYTRCILKEIAKSPLPEPHGKVEDRECKVDNVPGNQEQLNKMAAARRLWDGNYIRIDGFRRELSHWFNTIPIEESHKKNIMNGLEGYVKNGGNFFIELAEGLIGNPDWVSKVVQLEALRYFSKNASHENLQIISYQMEGIIP